MSWDELGYSEIVQTGTEFNSDDAATYASLVELVRSGRAIAVIGAGVSVSAGFPTWHGLLSELRAALQERDASFTEQVPDSDKWLDYADKLRNGLDAHGGEVFANQIGRLFHRLPSGVTNAKYEHIKAFHLSLVKLPFAGVTTTNFDHVLEQAIEEAYGRDACAVQTPRTVCIHGGNLPDLSHAIRSLASPRAKQPLAVPECVIHWHGSYGSPPTIVLSAQQFEQAYGFSGVVTRPARSASGALLAPRMTRLLAALSAVLTMQRAVFIGFSLEDPYFVPVLGQVADLLWEWEQRVHFAVLPLITGDPDKERRQRETARKRLGLLGIHPVWYPVVEGDYGALPQLIQMIERDVATDEAVHVPAVNVTAPHDAGTVMREPARVPPLATPVVRTAPTWVTRAVAEFEQKGGRIAD